VPESSSIAEIPKTPNIDVHVKVSGIPITYHQFSMLSHSWS